MPSPLISVIIPAHDEEQYIWRPLSSLEKQSFRDFEVIVVADSCSDGTKAIAQGNGCRVIEVSYANVGKARNAGIRSARGSILVFLDADVRVSRDYLRRTYEAAKRGFQVGRPDYYIDSRNPLVRYQYGILNIMGAQTYPNTFFITKKAQERIGLFPEYYAYCHEDLAYGNSINRRYRACMLKAKAYNSDRRFRKHGVARELLVQMLNASSYYMLDRSLGVRIRWDYSPVR